MSIYDFQVTAIGGRMVNMADYRGKVLLLVNTASACGYARQLAGLQSLYDAYRERGFEVLGFPCNQFNGKEPGSGAEAQQACESRFGATFPQFEKLEVRGPGAHPLFVYLTEQAPFQGLDVRTPNGRWLQEFLQRNYPQVYEGDGIKWNFSKFLIGRDGRVSQRFEPTVEPEEVESAIRALL